VANTAARELIDAAVALTASHAHAPARDVLDVTMKGRGGQVLNFIEVGARNGSLADPGSAFGQLVARAFDAGMTPAEWAAFTDSAADPVLRDACLNVWRDEVFARFSARYRVTVQGLP
jgi:hypothetical protein